MNSTDVAYNYQYKGSDKTTHAKQATFAAIIELIDVANIINAKEKVGEEGAEKQAFDAAIFLNHKDMYEFILMLYSHYADRPNKTFDQEIFYKKAEEIINNIDTNFKQINPNKL
jgi:hypothetical protein